MQPQWHCEHTLARRGGIVVDRPSVRSQPSLRGFVRRASAAILHAPALCGSALYCRRWPGSRALCRVLLLTLPLNLLLRNS